MRLSGLTLSALLLAAAIAAAQQPTTPPAAPPPQPAPGAATLDRYLLLWEKEMQKVQTLAARLKRTEKDTAVDSTQVFLGYALYAKSGSGANAVNKAMLEMKYEGKNDIAEKFVCTGTYLYQFVPAEKKIKYFEVPRPKPGQVTEENNFLSFLFGMKAEDAKKRYDLKVTKEDKDYVYVEVLPLRPEDKEDFKKAQIVLNKETFLPRRLWFVSGTKSEIIWDIDPVKKDVAVDPRYFDPPKKPDGWTLEAGRKAEPAAPPKVIRSDK